MKKLIAIILILTSLTACAQITERDYEERYERSLLDSAIRYEQIKPVLLNLQVAYEYKGKEVEALRLQISDMRLQYTLREKEFEKQLAEARKAGNKKLKTGLTIGVVGGFILGLTTH